MKRSRIASDRKETRNVAELLEMLASSQKRFYPFSFTPPPSTEDVRAISVVFCPVCGQTSEMDPFTENNRESGFCSVCGSWNRQRAMAVVLLRAIKAATGASLTHLASPAMPDTLEVFSAEYFGAVHKTLGRLPGYKWSRFAGSEYNSGDEVKGAPHQDLTATSFLEDQFDIVLTADVLEHIPEPYLAHQEIYRILKQGGAHVFTVPCNMNNPMDDQRAVVTDGAVIHLAAPEWHGPAEDSNLVYTVFGLEMITHLWILGFQLNVHEVICPNMGIVGPGAIVFEAIKQHKPIPRKIPTGSRSIAA